MSLFIYIFYWRPGLDYTCLPIDDRLELLTVIAWHSQFVSQQLDFIWLTNWVALPNMLTEHSGCCTGITWLKHLWFLEAVYIKASSTNFMQAELSSFSMSHRWVVNKTFLCFILTRSLFTPICFWWQIYFTYGSLFTSMFIFIHFPVLIIVVPMNISEEVLNKKGPFKRMCSVIFKAIWKKNCS